jgi:hypothetical protein
MRTPVLVVFYLPSIVVDLLVYEACRYIVARCFSHVVVVLVVSCRRVIVMGMKMIVWRNAW